MELRTDGRTDGEKDGRTERQTDGRKHGRADGQTDRRTDASEDGWPDEGRADGRKGGRTESRTGVAPAVPVPLVAPVSGAAPMAREARPVFPVDGAFIDLDGTFVDLDVCRKCKNSMKIDTSRWARLDGRFWDLDARCLHRTVGFGIWTVGFGDLDGRFWDAGGGGGDISYIFIL